MSLLRASGAAGGNRRKARKRDAAWTGIADDSSASIA